VAALPGPARSDDEYGARVSDDGAKPARKGLDELTPAELGRLFPIEVVAYDPRWPARYAELATELRARFGDAVLDVAHFGSTAVPRLPSKPTIDVLLEVADLDVVPERLTPALELDGWHALWRGDIDPGHWMLVRGYSVDGFEPGVQVAHVHVVTPGHPFGERRRFAEHLREHPDEARAYALLKRELSVRHRYDREAYTEGKTAFVLGVMARLDGEG
jgi:GrpB-like predicted nucleotidyltransferase (UPF0157 family)